MLQRQGLAVHADRQHGVAVVLQHLQRRRGAETVNGSGKNHVSTLLGPGHLEYVPDGHAQPFGIAGEVSAHRVRDAGQGDVGLDQPGVEQVLETEPDLLFDHAVDPQFPVLGIDLGHA